MISMSDFCLVFGFHELNFSAHCSIYYKIMLLIRYWWLHQ